MIAYHRGHVVDTLSQAGAEAQGKAERSRLWRNVENYEK